MNDNPLINALAHCMRIASGAEDGKYPDIVEIAAAAIAKHLGIAKHEAKARVTKGTQQAIQKAREMH